jgi:hypothetical protein
MPANSIKKRAWCQGNDIHKGDEGEPEAKKVSKENPLTDMINRPGDN